MAVYVMPDCAMNSPNCSLLLVVLWVVAAASIAGLVGVGVGVELVAGMEFVVPIVLVLLSFPKKRFCVSSTCEITSVVASAISVSIISITAVVSGNGASEH